MTVLDTMCARAHASAIRDAVALLMTLGEGAEPPLIAGDAVRIICAVPEQFLDAYSDWIARYHAGAGGAPASGGTCGAWSGVLMPAQREAARLVQELFDGISAVSPLPSGGYRLTLNCDLARHDRLALCLASLPEVASLIAEAAVDPDCAEPDPEVGASDPQEVETA